MERVRTVTAKIWKYLMFWQQAILSWNPIYTISQPQRLHSQRTWPSGPHGSFPTEGPVKHYSSTEPGFAGLEEIMAC